MEEYLKKFTQRIITEAEDEVELENRKYVDSESLTEEKSSEIVGRKANVKPHNVYDGYAEVSTTEKKTSVTEQSTTDAANDQPTKKKKKRRAPPPPVHDSLALPKKEQENKLSTKPNVEATSKRAVPTPLPKTNQTSGRDDDENEEKLKAKCSPSGISVGTTSLKESVSDLSLGNPFHPLYEWHIGQQQKHTSLGLKDVSDSCSEFSLSNPFHPEYDEITGTTSLTESESELSLSNPFNPHYTDTFKASHIIKAEDVLADILVENGRGQEEEDEIDDKAVKGKKGFISRLKRLFASLIPCIKKKRE